MKKYRTIFKYDLKKEYISEHLNEAMNVDNHKLSIAEICINRYRKRKKILRLKNSKE